MKTNINFWFSLVDVIQLSFFDLIRKWKIRIALLMSFCILAAFSSIGYFQILNNQFSIFGTKELYFLNDHFIISQKELILFIWLIPVISSIGLMVHFINKIVWHQTIISYRKGVKREMLYSLLQELIIEFVAKLRRMNDDFSGQNIFHFLKQDIQQKDWPLSFKKLLLRELFELFCNSENAKKQSLKQLCIVPIKIDKNISKFPPYPLHRLLIPITILLLTNLVIYFLKN